jgi:hypothetical protein
MKSSPVTNFLKTPQAIAKVATPSSGAHAKATPTSMPRPAPKEETIAAPEPVKEEEQPLLPISLLDYSYEDPTPRSTPTGPLPSSTSKMKTPLGRSVQVIMARNYYVDNTVQRFIANHRFSLSRIISQSPAQGDRYSRPSFEF